MNLSILDKFLKKTPVDTIIGCLYYVNAGYRKGQSILFIDKNTKNAIYNALAFPEMEVLEIPETSVNNGKTSNILEFIERVPKKVFETCKNEYNFRCSSNK